MTHEANREVLGFGTGAANDGESLHSAMVKIQTNMAYLFALGDSSPRYVPDNADLQNMSNVQDKEIVITGGYYADGDNGGNIFIYDSGASATCNGVTIFDGPGGDNSGNWGTSATWAGTGTGRFYALDPVNLRYRQCGGGTYDDVRMGAVATLSDITLTFDPGTTFYFVTAPEGWTFTNRQTWIGYGAEIRVNGTATTNTDTKGNASRFVIQADDFEMRGMHFRYHIDNVILSLEGKGFLAEDCHFDDCWDSNSLPAIYMYGAQDVEFNRCRFNFDSATTGHAAIEIGDTASAANNCQNVVIKNSTVEGIGQTQYGSYYLIFLQGCEGFTFEGNMVGDGTGTDIIASGIITPEAGGSGTVSDVTIRNNKFYLSSEYCNTVWFQSADCQYVEISGNYLDKNSTYLAYLVRGRDIHIHNNRMGDYSAVDTDFFWIFAYAYSSGSNMQRVVVENNFSSVSGIRFRNAATSVNFEDITVRGNTVPQIYFHVSTSGAGASGPVNIIGNTVRCNSLFSFNDAGIRIRGFDATSTWENVKVSNNHIDQQNSGDPLVKTDYVSGLWLIGNSGSGAGDMEWEDTSSQNLYANQANMWNRLETELQADAFGDETDAGAIWAMDADGTLHLPKAKGGMQDGTPNKMMGLTGDGEMVTAAAPKTTLTLRSYKLGSALSAGTIFSLLTGVDDTYVKPNSVGTPTLANHTTQDSMVLDHNLVFEVDGILADKSGDEDATYGVIRVSDTEVKFTTAIASGKTITFKLLS